MIDDMTTGWLGMISTASSNVKRDFLRNRVLTALLAGYLIVWTVTAINPVDRFDWFLENILAFTLLGMLSTTYRRFPFSDLSYVMIFVFMCLHAVGAHYTYSEVPLGFWIRDVLDLSRNNYDRWVHFGFGFLIVYPAREIALRIITPIAKLASLVGFTFIVTASAVYEIIEWGVALIVDPQAAMAYTGTQGDVFDSQKDMALAATGAIVSLLTVALVSMRTRKRLILPR